MGCCGGRRRAQSPQTGKNKTANASRRIRVSAGPHRGKEGVILQQPRVGVYSIMLDGETRAREFFSSLLSFIP